ncbi:MAG: RluA family pseudouridine synthase [Clostridia bacterium]|nr:RluA family pseudouridine synthase [Clostridia bacterium]
MKIITVNENDSGQRVDKFLSKLLPTMPRSLLYKQLRNKRVKRNKKALSAQDVLSCGDELCLYINDEFFGEKKQITARGKGLLVVYEDDNILVCDKPAGQPSHGGEDSLLSQMQGYLFEKGEYDPSRENSFAPGLCNRLDRNTRGLLIGAKTAAAQKLLNEKIKNREVTKKYRCVLCGVPEQKSGRLIHYLKADEKENRVRVVKKDTPGAKEAILDYEVIKAKNGKALAEITLLTGRKHQIRVQFANIGHPLLGDSKYGAPKDSRFHYQALCAYSLTFDFAGDSGILENLKGKTLSIVETVFEDVL